MQKIVQAIMGASISTITITMRKSTIITTNMIITIMTFMDSVKSIT